MARKVFLGPQGSKHPEFLEKHAFGLSWEAGGSHSEEFRDVGMCACRGILSIYLFFEIH